MSINSTNTVEIEYIMANTTTSSNSNNSAFSSSTTTLLSSYLDTFMFKRLFDFLLVEKELISPLLKHGNCVKVKF